MNNEHDVIPVPRSSRRTPAHNPGVIHGRDSFGGNASEPSMILEYLRTFWNNKWQLVSFILAGCTIAFLFNLATLPVFRAHTSVEIQSLNSEFLNMRAVDPNGQSAGASDEAFIQTQIKLFQSESLMAEVVEKLNSVPGKTVPRQDLLSIWQRQLGKQSGGALSRKDAVRFIALNLKVKPMGMTHLVEISCDGWDGDLAAEFCNTITQQYISDGLAARWAAAQKTSEWLSKQVVDVRDKLQEAETRLQAMQRDNSAFYNTDRDTIAQEKLRQLQNELSRAEEDRITRQSLYEMSQSAPADSLPMVLDSAPLKEYKVKKTDLNRQLVESGPLLPAHPKVQHLKAEIAELDAAIQRERLNVIARVKHEFDASAQRTRMLGSAFSEQQKIVVRQLEKDAQINMLRREVESNRSLYQSLMQRAKEAGFVTAMRASTVRVVDPATVPLVPVSPRRLATTAIGGAFAALAGMMFALVRQRNDPRLRNPNDVGRHLKLWEVGVIPSVKVDHRLRGELYKFWQKGKRGDLDLVTWRYRDSLLAESYRVAVNSIFIHKSRDLKSSVLVVSSPSMGEGKTTAACNLAIAIAETRKRVVIVDGDLRNPRLHTSMGVENDFGVRETLRNPNGLTDNDFDRLIKSTPVPGLSVVTSGSRGPEDCVSLLHSPNLKQLIKGLGSRFDVVLIDTPPMLNLADARIFCESADGAILVVRASSTTREMAVAAYDSFAAANTPVIGVILNDFDASRETGYSYYNKYYEYYKPLSA